MIIGINPHSYMNKFVDFAFCYFRIFRVVNIVKRKSKNAPVQFSNSEYKELSLTELMNKYGSDKGDRNGYTEVYEKLLKEKRNTIKIVIEIGIGTNDPKLFSSMGVNGKPGASLRAWRDYCPNAQIYGLDVDRNVLFSERSISTAFVDQLNIDTFAPVKNLINEPFDLVIIDGLHTPRADFNSLVELLPNLKSDGDFFIEDVGNSAINLFWPLIFAILRKRYLVTTYLSREGTLKAGNMIHITKKSK